MSKKLISVIVLFFVISVLIVGCSNKPATNKFLGSWQDINTPSRYAKIYANDKKGYTWEDNEGKYEAYFDKDTLKVKVDTYEAIVVYDKASDHLKATLLGEKFEFSRK